MKNKRHIIQVITRASILTGCRPATTGADYPYSIYFATKFWPEHVNYNNEPFDAPEITTFPETFSSELPHNTKIQIQFNYPVYYNGTTLNDGEEVDEVKNSNM